MLRTKVSSAAQAFREGDYASAMVIYQELGERLGREYFAANITLCQLRMGGSAGYAELASLPTKQMRVAGVMDEFTFHSYDPECQLLQLHPEQCIEQLEQFKPHLLFIESAWQGLDQLWKQKISTNGPEINACIDWCKRNSVPTLFWNKEDPVHFGTFIPLAKQVDYVFTTDIDCVPKYKFHVGHDRVFFLPFAAQPKTHNPVEVYQRKDAFNFAGSYYLRYPERQRDFASLIDAVKDLRPVDIYDRNADNPHPHYTFPDQYKPMILGKLPFSEIDKAYKGYRYGINMNTIKQSQSMFARRVFELLASNTVVVSNFSRGVRLLFGDLVVSSDNQSQLAQRMDAIVKDELSYRKLRLLGLRKVMTEHTYAQRLAYIQAKLLGRDFSNRQVPVLLIAEVNNEEQVHQVLDSFQRQLYKNKILYLVAPKSIESNHIQHVVYCSDLNSVGEKIGLNSDDSLVGVLDASDYYGENYLTDLVLASTYSDAPAFGKYTRYSVKNQKLMLINESMQYRLVDSFSARAGLVRKAVWQSQDLAKKWRRLTLANVELPGTLAIDEFNYVEGGASVPKDDLRDALDLDLLDQGVSFSGHLAPVAEALPASLNQEASDTHNLPQLNAQELREWIPARSGVALSVTDDKLRVRSTLKPGQHEYLYCRSAKTRDEMNLVLNSQFQLFGEGAVSLRTVFEFQDKNGKKIAHQMNGIGDKHALAIPAHCAKIRFGLRVEGPGEAWIEKLVLGSTAERPAAVITKSPYMVLAKQYPAYDDLYRYGFLHSRVRAYKASGQMVDMFRIQNGPAEYREFENIDVATGDSALLDATLATGQVKHVMVHILDQHMWKVLEKYLDSIKVTVWAHGSEIQAWWRRKFEFKGLTESEIERKKKLGENRNKFWAQIFKNPHANVNFVFVSNYFAQEVFSDLKVSLPKDKYKIIHNPIDTDLFGFQKKDPSLRKRILSIRPYSAHAYANDLSVKAVLELSKSHIFKDLNFHFIGNGEFFDETLEPLKVFSNIKIEKRFLTQTEISNIHKEYGLFLVPTRCDSQGVSRDEAMSSGLVPITNAVSAVPEFVDDTCGFLVAGEDYVGLSEAIEEIYNKPEVFVEFSKNASNRVFSQSNKKQVIDNEIDLLRDII
ncbi:glycosyltransferase [Alcaligenes faecalis]|uniref:glycosyltransferase family protein n=1 Tax=Alcaligenes faecalis TaxID=511 RepID=UPI00355909E4